jgi:phosphoribosylformylglycinamidine cyclo-ligase
MKTYKDSGVDIEAGDAASRSAQQQSRQTYRPEVTEMGGIAAFDARFATYKKPLLLGATDGVGTKLKIAIELQKHDSIGIDLVAMCVNDLVRRGAEPLMFLPYLAMQKIVPEIVHQIMEGVVAGCQLANCSIIGGETAELTDIYHQGEYDLAATAIGVVEKTDLITGATITRGDVVIGIPSSGIHSNGYTLVRKLLLSTYSLYDTPELLRERTLGEVLLTPTRIYVREVLAVLRAGVPVHGIAHITGSGLLGKLGAIIPEGCTAQLKPAAWERHPIFTLIQQDGQIAEEEMFHALNMGIGMCLVVPPRSVASVLKLLPDARQIGEIVTSKGITPPVMFA